MTTNYIAMTFAVTAISALVRALRVFLEGKDTEEEEQVEVVDFSKMPDVYLNDALYARFGGRA